MSLCFFLNYYYYLLNKGLLQVQFVVLIPLSKDSNILTLSTQGFFLFNPEIEGAFFFFFLQVTKACSIIRFGKIFQKQILSSFSLLQLVLKDLNSTYSTNIQYITFITDIYHIKNEQLSTSCSICGTCGCPGKLRVWECVTGPLNSLSPLSKKGPKKKKKKAKEKSLLSQNKFQ